jgi:protein tyrosine/serine phosphatase
VSSRIISWDGFHNARDLGGLPTRDGQTTRFGQLIRSATVRLVTPAGWRAAYAAGVRTVVDLRSEPEVIDHVPWGDDGPVRHWVELDPWNDSEYWRAVSGQGINGTPLTFDPFLVARPERVAAVVRAIAAAPPGGVLYHCAAGRDRTGVLTVVLLALAGVDADTIADDYDLSHAAVRQLHTVQGRDLAELDRLARVLVDRGLSTRDVMRALLKEFDARRYLLDAGVSEAELRAVRTRLLDA